MQPRVTEGGKLQNKETPQESDRAVVKNFGDRKSVNSASGFGKKENPGKPT